MVPTVRLTVKEKIVSRIRRQGVAVVVLGVWLMYTWMEIGVRIIGNEGKGEREEKKINLPVMFCFHTQQKAMPLKFKPHPKR